MSKGIFIALTAVGVLLLGWGMQAYRSVGSEVTETFTGAPSDKAIWLLAAGGIFAIVGAFGLFRGMRI
jgi:Protein of unknown function (DUF3185)